MTVEVRKVRRKALKRVRTIKEREHPQTIILLKTEEMLGQGRQVENQMEKVVKCRMCRADVSGIE